MRTHADSDIASVQTERPTVLDFLDLSTTAGWSICGANSTASPCLRGKLQLCRRWNSVNATVLEARRGENANGASFAAQRNRVPAASYAQNSVGCPKARDGSVEFVAGALSFEHQQDPAIGNHDVPSGLQPPTLLA